MDYVDLLGHRELAAEAGESVLDALGGPESADAIDIWMQEGAYPLDVVGAASRGYDAGKKINGRKRHIAMDTLGPLLAVIITPASVQDRDGAHPLLALLREQFCTISLVWPTAATPGVWSSRPPYRSLPANSLDSSEPVNLLGTV